MFSSYASLPLAVNLVSYNTSLENEPCCFKDPVRVFPMSQRICQMLVFCRTVLLHCSDRPDMARDSVIPEEHDPTDGLFWARSVKFWKAWAVIDITWYLSILFRMSSVGMDLQALIYNQAHKCSFSLNLCHWAHICNGSYWALQTELEVGANWSLLCIVWYNTCTTLCKTSLDF